MALNLPWEQLRQEYEREGLTYQELAQRYGVSTSTVSRRARADGWGRRGGSRRRIEEVSGQLLAVVEEALAGRSDPLSVRELKDLTALLREMLALRELAQKEKGGEETVHVVLEGPLEDWGS